MQLHHHFHLHFLQLRQLLLQLPQPLWQLLLLPPGALGLLAALFVLVQLFNHQPELFMVDELAAVASFQPSFYSTNRSFDSHSSLIIFFNSCTYSSFVISLLRNEMVSEPGFIRW